LRINLKEKVHSIKNFMNMIATIKNFLQKKGSYSSEKSVVDAYDIWSCSYDMQPGNLMLDLDENIFTGLIKNINLENKRIADIGCGTGRHWQKLYDKMPALVIGFDVSAGMLDKLRRKFPDAITQQTTNNLFAAVPAAFFDCLVTTLTIAHIKNIDEAIASWSRILKDGGDLFITDFHPEILAKGGKRSFRQDGKSLSVTNYIHSLEEVKNIFNKYGFAIIMQEEKYINQEVRPYYEAQNALHVYDRFKGMPVIYGLHLKKQHVAG
jgi:ubiquinone/menaquinone biosynthesis C-methylase UbiE